MSTINDIPDLFKSLQTTLCPYFIFKTGVLKNVFWRINTDQQWTLLIQSGVNCIAEDTSTDSLDEHIVVMRALKAPIYDHKPD